MLTHHPATTPGNARTDLDRPVESTDYDPLDGGLDVDVAVVGGGIVGVTTALKLKERGESVALLERDRIVLGVTGHTTAKVTALHGLIYDYLTEHVGEEQASLYAEANEAAIDDVEATVDGTRHRLRLRARTGVHVHSRTGGGPGLPPAPARDTGGGRRAARRAGLDASFVEETDLPYDVGGAVRVADQAHFHPVTTCSNSPRRSPATAATSSRRRRSRTSRAGAPVPSRRIGEPSRPTTSSRDPLPHPRRRRLLRAADPETLLRRRGDPERGRARRDVLPAIRPLLSPFRPYPDSDGPMVLVGGQNHHRTGEGGSTETRYERLEAQARKHFDVDSVEYRWSTQDYRSVDRVPFVSPAGPGTSNVYVATGFGGWG